MIAAPEDRERLTAEAADLIYHLPVVLAARDITSRKWKPSCRGTGQSGLDDKASRKGG